MDSPFLFLILFFSNLLQAYIFPVARTWQAQTCERSTTIVGDSKQTQLCLGCSSLLTTSSGSVLLRPETEAQWARPRRGQLGDQLLFPNLLRNIGLIISLSPACFLSHLLLSVQILISQSAPPLPLLPPQDTRKIQIRVWPQFHRECNSRTQNNSPSVLLRLWCHEGLSRTVSN